MPENGSEVWGLNQLQVWTFSFCVLGLTETNGYVGSKSVRTVKSLKIFTKVLGPRDYNDKRSDVESKASLSELRQETLISSFGESAATRPRSSFRHLILVTVVDLSTVRALCWWSCPEGHSGLCSIWEGVGSQRNINMMTKRGKERRVRQSTAVRELYIPCFSRARSTNSTKSRLRENQLPKLKTNLNNQRVEKELSIRKNQCLPWTLHKKVIMKGETFKTEAKQFLYTKSKQNLNSRLPPATTSAFHHQSEQLTIVSRGPEAAQIRRLCWSFLAIFLILVEVVFFCWEFFVVAQCLLCSELSFLVAWKRRRNERTSQQVHQATIQNISALKCHCVLRQICEGITVHPGFCKTRSLSLHHKLTKPQSILHTLLPGSLLFKCTLKNVLHPWSFLS